MIKYSKFDDKSSTLRWQSGKLLRKTVALNLYQYVGEIFQEPVYNTRTSVSGFVDN